MLAVFVYTASAAYADGSSYRNRNTQEVIPVESIVLKGSIVPDGTQLQYAGDDVWKAVVDLDKPTANEYIDRNFYFAINGDESLAIRRIGATTRVGMQSEGLGALENIRLNNGTYEITLDLANYTCTVDREIDPMRVSVFGSSVANGQGAESMRGYAYLYGEQLKERHAAGSSPNALYTSGVSIGGNTTLSLIDRYIDVINDFGRYVIIGLSMGNEGLHGVSDKQSVFNQFKTNMLALIASLREDGKVPVVMNNYTHSDYNEADYEKIKAINLLIHEWDVPSVNTLGAIDDGAGRWAAGYVADAAHPNTNGHREFFYAMVPSLFDALEDGKPLPERDRSQSVLLGAGETMELQPEGTVHPFTVSLRLNASGPGTLITFPQGSGRLQSTVTLSVDREGNLVYSSSGSKAPLTVDADMLDGAWHDVAVSHYYARGMTKIYVDGNEVASRKENINFNSRLTIGDETGTHSLQLAEVAFWRAGMNQEEMKAFADGAMLRSSLEIYSPMCIDEKGLIPNLAQSTNSLKLNARNAVGTVGEEVASSEAYFDLSGTKVSSPQTGKIYVRQSSEGSSKVIF